MAVPSVVSDCSATASSNSPTGGESIGTNADNYLRAAFAFIRQLANGTGFLHGSDVASASTLNLDTSTGDLVDVTGTTTITAITLAEGAVKTVRFTGALTLTHGSSLVLPGSANITTVAGDYAIFRGYASSVVRCIMFSPAGGYLTIASAKQVPTATVAPYAGSSAPTGWLLCYGQAVSRTTYADLFAIIDTTYGTGDGSTTFNLPDLRGRTVAGVDNMGGSAASRITSGVSGITGTTLGAVGGNQNMHGHTHTATVTDPGHTHTLSLGGDGVANGKAQRTTNSLSSTTTDSNTTGITVSNSTTGSGSSENVQPTMMLNYIIKI